MNLRASTSNQINTTDSEGWSRYLTQAAFSLLVTLVTARAISFETIRDPFEVGLGAQAAPQVLGATGSFLLDWLACLPALLVLVRRVAVGHDRYPLRTSISFAFLLPLAIWAAASTFWSSDHFLSIISVSHFVAATVVMWTAFQLVRHPLRLRMIAGICFGVLLVLIATGIIYRFVELPEFQRSVRETWPKILEERGWQPGSFLAEQFRKKIESGELAGFYASPNTYAAAMVMLAIFAVGGAWQRFRDRDQAGFGIVIVLAVVLAIPITAFTRSRTAFASPMFAIIAFVFVAFVSPTLTRFRKPLFVASIAGVLAIAAGIVLYGTKHKNLIHDSLTFRWKYWVATSRMITAHPLAGVGWNSFGDYYLPFRLPEAPEEIKDPHNIFVRVTAELGVLGLILVVGWLVSLIAAIAKPAEEGEFRTATLPSLSNYADRIALKIVVLFAGGAILVNIAATVDLTQEWSWVVLEILKRSLYFALLCAGLIVVAFRSVETPAFDDRPAMKIRIAGVIAILIFLLHNVIDFSFFETGPMWLFMLIAGATLAATCNVKTESVEDVGWRRLVVGIGLLGAIVLWIGAGAVVGLPLIFAESKALAADDAMRARHPALAARLLLEAADTLPFSNADYYARAANAMSFASEAPSRIRDTLTAAITANPRVANSYRHLAESELRQTPIDSTRVRAAFDRAIELNPNDVETRLEYARALEQFGASSAAGNQYRLAIRMNDLLNPDEPKRLPLEQRAAIAARARELLGE